MFGSSPPKQCNAPMTPDQALHGQRVPCEPEGWWKAGGRLIFLSSRQPPQEDWEPQVRLQSIAGAAGAWL